MDSPFGTTESTDAQTQTHDECKAEVRRLRQTIVHLGEASAIETTATMLVHELAQPIAAACNYLAVARRSSVDPKRSAAQEPAEAVECAEKCLMQAADVIRSVKSAANGAASQHQAVNLGEIIREVLKLYGPAWDVQPTIEIVPGAERVLADPIQVAQVLLNLIRNAAEATLGQPVRSLHLKARTFEGDKVLVRVEDDGPGIPDSMMAKLFSPFSSSKAEGLGVGLSICRTIIENHDGRIWAERLPKGTALCFTLGRA